MRQNLIQNNSNLKNSSKRQNSRSRGSTPLEGCRPMGQPTYRGVDTPRAEVAVGFRGFCSYKYVLKYPISSLEIMEAIYSWSEN